MCKVSFIIPAFNAEKTIERTVDSILNQVDTKIEYEVIVVNDGSTDNTTEVLKKYNNKITVLNKENSGVAVSRNYGVEKSNGEYIIFVDSDDFISSTLLKDIENYIEKDVDLIKWSPIWCDAKGNKIKDIALNEYMECTGEDGFNYLYGSDYLISAVWNYAYKKEIIIPFPEGTAHEDFAVAALMIIKAKTMVITGKEEYYYVQTDSSAMRGNNHEKELKRCKDILLHYDNIYEESKKLEIKEETRENLRIFITNSIIVMVNDLDEENKKYFIEEIKKRKLYKNIKCRNIKQLLKRVLLKIKY